MIQIPDSFIHYVVLAALLIVMAGLFVKKFKPTAVFIYVVILLVLLGIVPLESVLTNLANSSVVTIFILIFITAALRRHFNLVGLLDHFFRSIKNPRVFTLSFTTVVASLSSVINNTPIVALFIPYVFSWAKRRKFSPSKFLIPLSYAATLGGTITLIGTSTNLVLNGLITSNGFEPLRMTDFLIPGLMVTGAGLLFMAIFSQRLLPAHRDLLDKFESDKRNYIVETKLASDSIMVGKKVSQAGLRNLEDLYLVEIIRNGELISPVSPDEILNAGDLLYFAGDTAQVSELIANPTLGLYLPKTEKFQLGDDLDIVEALIPALSDLGGVRVKQSNFRERFDAAIVAIQRDGQRLGGKIGNLKLEYGDLLLLTAGKNFRENIRTDKNLISLAYKEKMGNELKIEKRLFGVVFLAVLSGWIMGWFNLLFGLIILLTALSSLKMLTFEDLKKQFNPDLYLILVGAITFGTAMLDSGTADWLVQLGLSHFSHLQPKTIMILLFISTLALTSFVTNVAAVSIAFPLAVAFLPSLHVEPSQVFLMIAFAASCSFLTPVSYQTNLMVYEPGNYRSVDFLKIGVPLTILYALICTAYFV